MRRKKIDRKLIFKFYETCSVCSLQIIGPESLEHQNTCSESSKKPCCYIDPTRQEFATNRIEVRNEFQDERNLSPAQLNSLIFMNLNVLKNCNFVIGEYVLVTSTGSDGFVGQIVKRAWPVNDKSIEVIRCTKSEVTKLGKELNQVKVNKLVPEKIKNAAEVSLKLLDVNLNSDLADSLTLLLGKELDSHVFMSDDKLTLTFLNKTFNFEIIHVQAEESLVEGIGSLNLEESFYKITSKTSFIIETEPVVAVNSANNEYPPIFIGGLEVQESEALEIINAARSNGARGGLTKGILIHGSPGCGKSLLIKSVVQKSCLPVITISGSDIFSRFYGETEANLSAAFKKIKPSNKFSLIVIEDIHNLAPKDEKNDINRRVTAALVDKIDEIAPRRALILATTSSVDVVHPSVRRSGRIDYEIEVPAPSPKAREQILAKILEKHQMKFKEEEIQELALTTHGYTGADLDSLITKAFYAVKADSISFIDVQRAMQTVKPSAMREVQIESPNIKWTDIGGQKELKLKLQQAIEWPIRHPETFLRLGITPPRGLLMFGPPGCSKTMIAKALATECGVNFLSIKGSELFSMWVGESEKAVQKLFRKAREVAPSIIFFDEIDAIGSERSGGANSGSSVKERVLSQMLTEMDGINVLRDVSIVAATNRPDLIDSALMRPGRLDRVIFVDLPDAETRKEIFRIKLSKTPIEEDLDVSELVQRTEGYSGAEIQAVVQEAALNALEKSLDAQTVAKENFQFALNYVKPRTSPELMQLYRDYLVKHQHR